MERINDDSRLPFGVDLYNGAHVLSWCMRIPYAFLSLSLSHKVKEKAKAKSLQIPPSAQPPSPFLYGSEKTPPLPPADSKFIDLEKFQKRAEREEQKQQQRRRSQIQRKAGLRKGEEKEIVKSPPKRRDLVYHSTLHAASNDLTPPAQPSRVAQFL